MYQPALCARCKKELEKQPMSLDEAQEIIHEELYDINRYDTDIIDEAWKTITAILDKVKYYVGEKSTVKNLEFYVENLTAKAIGKLDDET